MDSTSHPHTSLAPTASQPKRRWTERDWDVAMEAQSFVAVYADASADEPSHAITPANTVASSTTKKTTKKRKAGDKKKTRATSAVVDEPVSDPQPGRVAVPLHDAFWLAQLQDDVTENMFDTDATVRVTWLNRVDDARAGDNIAEHRYTIAYDDRIDVQSILCGVYVVESTTGEMTLTANSAARVAMSVRRTRGETTPEEDAQESEGEAPPVVSRSARSKRVTDEEADDNDDNTGSGRARRRSSAGRRSSGTGGGRRVLRAKTPPKASKRIAEMHIPPHYARVDETKYEDRELLGQHVNFDDCSGDLLSSNREIMRAVRTQNYPLLKTLVEDAETRQKLYSFRANQSADVKRTAMQYAIQHDDVQAVALLQRSTSTLSKRPSVSLPSHSTGAHTSAYSDYNRRAINASRGGREGNNALLEDVSAEYSWDETTVLWTHPQASIKMLTALHPQGDWVNDYAIPQRVATVLRAGNLTLASKLVGVLGKNGGWGFNDLHVASLSTTDQPVPTFRSSSVVKKAQQSKITPLHVAAINPNIKYLEALWENGGSEQSSIRDDAQFEPIHYAAASPSPNAARFLLERRASLMSRTKEKHTPLMRALITGREETAIAMLEHVAAEPEDVAKQVLTSRGPESYQLIHFAAENDCRAVLSHLLGMGVDVNALAAGQTTALSLAARRGHAECVAILLAHGAKVDRVDKLKRTPLMLAVKNGHTRIAACLINHDANVNAYDSSENSIVHYAASYGWMSCLALLRDAGADVWSRNSWGFVPLICAMFKQRAECAEFILKSDNAQRFLDFRDRSGRTMLYLQCEHSTNLKQIQYLLGKGLDPTIGDCDGKKPLDVLIDRVRFAGADSNSSSFFADAVRALVAHGAEVNYKSVYDDGTVTYPTQPLQLAIRNNARAIFDFLLLEAGADPAIDQTNGSADAWLTSAGLGAPGAYYLEKLLDKYPTPRAFPLQTAGGNIFHLIAGHASSSNLIPAELVERLLKYCLNAVELLHARNASSMTPLMVLYESRLALTGTTTNEKENAVRKQQDDVFVKIARLFATRITDVEALKKYITVWEPIDASNPSKESENMHTVSVLDSTILHTASRFSSDKPARAASEVTTSTAPTTGGFSFGSSLTTPPSTGFGFGGFGAASSAFSASPSGFGASPSGFGTTSSGFGAPSSGFGAPSSGFGFGSGRGKSRSSRSAFGSGFSFGSVTSTSTTQSSSLATWRGENVVELLLDACAPCKMLLDTPTLTERQTPLLISMAKNDLATARVLLAAGANPNYSTFRCTECETTEETQCVACSTRGLTDTVLLQAIRHVDMLKLLLEYGASTDCVVSGTLDTPLHLAMGEGNAEKTRLLLTHGASMAKLNAARSTPFATAISAGFSVDKKIPHEGEINFSTAALGSSFKPPSLGALSVATISPKRKTPLQAPQKSGTVIDVALSCKEAIAAIFIADEDERTPLHHAAAKRDLPLLTALLQRLGTSKKVEYVNKADAFGRTALHFALNSVSMMPNASFDVERFLFLSGASAASVDNFGLSPLHFALRKVNMDWHLGYDERLGQDVVKEQKLTGEYEAKKAEAFVSHLNDTPRESSDPVETLSNLIAAGCDPLVLDSLGRSALHLASSIGAFVCVSTLLSACSPSRRQQLLEQHDLEGFSPLGRAFEHGRETTITTLIQSGAQVSGTVTIRGQERSYFSVAVEKMMSGICHMLLNAGFSRRQAVEDAVCGNQLQLAKNLMVGLEVSNDRELLVTGNARGETLLHCLARSSTGFDDLSAEMAWTLVEDSLDVVAEDHDGNTALHFAAAMGNTRLMDFLLHHNSDVNAQNHVGWTPLMYALKQQTEAHRRITTFQYLLLQDNLDLRVCDADNFDTLALFFKHFLTAMENESAMLLWFELALRRHGDLNRAYAAMPSAEDDLFGNDKLGDSRITNAPLLVWASYPPSMTTRCLLLRVLLQHGASPSSTDSNGNSVLMHLVARNLFTEASLVLQECNVTRGQVRALIDTTNGQGLTALHLAITPLAYGSFENLEMIQLLVTNGASLVAQDKHGATPLDYATRQSSRRVFRFLKSRCPKLVNVSEDVAFDDAMDVDQWRDPPTFHEDAETYLKSCEDAGKITKARIAPSVNRNCDVGAVKSVFGLLNADDKVIEGEEYNALLTKVDVKHGKHGVNVFYRTQIVHDQLQSLYVVFTNWGRIGEQGKFQNTPFHSADEAVTEFKKIFKSKTSNAWEDRHNFEKRVGKYNLVQRVNFSTRIDNDVTRSFTEHLQYLKTKKIDVLTDFAPIVRSELNDQQLLNALFAITDVRNLGLAARDYQYQEDLPLAREDMLRSAMDMLKEIRAIVVEHADVKNEISAVSGNLASEDASEQLSELSDRLAAFTEDLSERSSRYYEIVPRNEDHFGSAIAAFDTLAAVDTELYRLKRLLEITHTYKMLLGAKLRQKQVHPIEYVVDSLQIHMTRLPTDNDECVMLTKYFSNGIRPSERSRYRVSNVFEVSRRGEAQRLKSCLESDPAFSANHTSLLWHGTSRTNLMGILSEGLRIAPPEAPHSGYAYGKGIYFSDVAAKSLNYCRYPYSIEEEVEEQDGDITKTTTKRRQVQYMLLCEVALGNQRDVRSSWMHSRDTLQSAGFHSVRAVGQHMPNGNESIVSPACGAKVPLGRVGRPGHDFECPSAWAVFTVAFTNTAYTFQSWQIDAEAWLNRALADKTSWKVGDSVSIDKSSDKALFFRKGFYCLLMEDDKVDIRVAEIGNAAGAWDIGVEFVVTPPPNKSADGTELISTAAVGPVVVAKARRYLNVHFNKPPKLAEGFSIPQLSAAGPYNEHIVYTPEQARIRYLVEVEIQ